MEFKLQEILADLRQSEEELLIQINKIKNHRIETIKILSELAEESDTEKLIYRVLKIIEVDGDQLKNVKQTLHQTRDRKYKVVMMLEY